MFARRPPACRVSTESPRCHAARNTGTSLWQQPSGRCRKTMTPSGTPEGEMRFDVYQSPVLARAPVDDIHILGAQPHRTPRRIHRHIAAADHRHLLAHLDRGGIPGIEVGLHEIGPGQEFIGGINHVEVFPGDLEKHRQPRPGGQINSIVAGVEQLIQTEIDPDHRIELDLHTQRSHVVDFTLDDFLGQAEFGNAIHQHSPRHMQGFEHGHLMPQDGQVGGHREPGGTGPDDRHPLAAGGCNVGDR